MNAAFVLAMLVLFLLLSTVSAMLFRSSRRAWWLWGGILFVGLVLLRRPVSDFMDPWFLGSVAPIPVVEIISGREFTVRGWLHVERHIILDGTRLPDTDAGKEAARNELARLLCEDGLVAISFSQTVRRMPEPWPATVRVGEGSANEHMLAQGYLVSEEPARAASARPGESETGLHGTEAVSDTVSRRGRSAEAREMPGVPQPEHEEATADTSATKPDKETGPGLPTWGRYVAWVLAGFFGATSLGMVLNRRYHGLIFLLTLTALALRSIVVSLQTGATVWPPIVYCILVVAFAGGGRQANKEFLEEHPNFRK